MKLGISVKIDVTKIDKARLFEGKKGTYLDLTAFIDLDNQGEYGDNGFISQSVSKEEREKDIKGNILGNVTVFFNDSNNAKAAPQQDSPPAMSGDDFSDDLPFSSLGQEYLV